jgi:3',5'-cyclic AMP phosphodiesterase CpdA
MPPGDVLLVAGDFTGRGKPHEIEDFDSWLAVQPYRVKIVIAGNHDLLFEYKPQKARQLLTRATYLEDTETVLRPTLFDRTGEEWRVRIYGSPWQPRFYDWAFNLDRGSAQLREKWREIPTGVDVLVTHGPPFEIMDHDLRGGRAGCELLREELSRIRPRLHVFGHLHGTCGIVEKNGTIFVNASMADERYEIHREPLVVDLTPVPYPGRM